MSQSLYGSVAVIGIDIGKNSFHVVGLDARGAIVLRQKWSRGQIEARFANMPRCLIGRPRRPQSTVSVWNKQPSTSVVRSAITSVSGHLR